MTTTKRHKLHARSAIFPALGSEHVRVGAPYILAVLHCIHANKHGLPFGDKNRFLAILPAAARESCVFKTDTLHDRQDAYYSEGFVDTVVEVGAILKLSECYIVGIRAKSGKDGGAQAVKDGGVTGEEVEEEREKGGGRVAACA